MIYNSNSIAHNHNTHNTMSFYISTSHIDNTIYTIRPHVSRLRLKEFSIPDRDMVVEFLERVSQP